MPRTSLRRRAYSKCVTRTQPMFADSADIFHDAPCVSKNWHRREAWSGAGRISSTQQSSASHQSSAVLAGVRSTIGIRISLHLTRATRSLQFPSAKASSVTITVPLPDEPSKPTAASMVRAHCITNPCASMSCATVASGLLLDTKITVPVCL
jgi:hypothetical protein